MDMDEKTRARLLAYQVQAMSNGDLADAVIQRADIHDDELVKALVNETIQRFHEVALMHHGQTLDELFSGERMERRRAYHAKFCDAIDLLMA
jgi:hypothetical protein